jgi:hypothetical protein
VHYWDYPLVLRNVVECGALIKQTKKKTEYREGRKAKQAFEETMKALFRVPKGGSKKLKKGKD